jgi:hypothetical protein
MDGFIKKESYTLDFVTGIRLPETTLDLHTIEVQGGIGTLRATWTPELAQDLEVYHNVDVEQELTNILTEQITQEIDNEILTQLGNLRDPIQPNRGRLLTPNEVRDIGRRGQQEELIERWRETGLLDGLNDTNRQSLAELFEGQAARMIREETNQATNNFQDLELPIVRRVIARTIANDLITVAPIGEIRYNEFLNNPPHPINEIGLYNHNLNISQDLIKWRTDDTWSYGSLYGSLIGIQMDMKPLRMLPKKTETLFDLLD